MPVLVRKIDRAKWRRAEVGSTADIPADTITCCLRTKSNTLSFWEAASEHGSDFDEVVLAMASAFAHLETVDLVATDPDHLRGKGVNITSTPGRTMISELASRHRDLAGLTYGTLGVVAGHIRDRIQQKMVYRIRKCELVSLLEKAIREERLDPNDLTADVRKWLSLDSQE